MSPSIDDYRRGISSSTTLMERSMEEAHTIDPQHGKPMAWRAGEESFDHARYRLDHESDRLGNWLQEKSSPESLSKAATKKLTNKGAEVLLQKYAPEAAALRQTAKTLMKEVAGAAAVAAGAEAAALAGAGGAICVVTRALVAGDELRHRSDLDGMESAVTELLAFDSGFKAAESMRLDSINPQKTVALFRDSYGNATEYGRQHLPELQASADSGAECAIAALREGGKASYLASHPDAAKRFGTDVAFNKGFENAMWLSTSPQSEAKLKALQHEIDLRNPRTSTPMHVQG